MTELLWGLLKLPASPVVLSLLLLRHRPAAAAAEAPAAESFCGVLGAGESIIRKLDGRLSFLALAIATVC